MTKKGEILGKKYNKAYSVSFSHKRTLRRQKPNMQSKRIWDPDKNQWVRIEASTSGIKLISKVGARKVLAIARKQQKINKYT